MPTTEDYARAIYEARTPGDGDYPPATWPPSHPEDVADWMARGEAARALAGEPHVATREQVAELMYQAMDSYDIQECALACADVALALLADQGGES